MDITEITNLTELLASMEFASFAELSDGTTGDTDVNTWAVNTWAEFEDGLVLICPPDDCVAIPFPFSIHHVWAVVYDRDWTSDNPRAADTPARDANHRQECTIGDRRVNRCSRRLTRPDVWRCRCIRRRLSAGIDVVSIDPAQTRCGG